ncbi:MAG: AraC family transcriptional regulator [Lachnospiraceae bacterium]|nr:AraC family transcriptional regulator [Lachnospiraceae bacterium]
MNKKRKQKMTYRYYEVPPGSPVLALLKEDWLHKDAIDTDSLHFHNHMEIGYCYNGNCSVTLGDEELACSGDMFTIIPKNYPHGTNIGKEVADAWEYLVIDADRLITDTYKDNLPMADKLIRRVNQKVHLAKSEDQRQIALLIQQIIETMRTQKELYQEEVNALTMVLLIRLAQWNRNEKDDINLPRMENSTIISPALDYISMVPERQIKIEELAEMCHISEPHFRRIFVNCMKMSPVKYINQVRIRRACDELKRTNESMAAISARAGFSTLSTFNRNFRRIMGISPQQWRKNPEQYEWKLLEYDIQSGNAKKSDSHKSPPPTKK